MSDFKWCHGPSCHKSHTQDRIRGSKGSKVLRTKKVKTTEWNRTNGWQYFCSQGCWNDFFRKYAPQCIAIAPRHEPLETPIEDPKKVTHQSDYNPSYSWTSTEIKERGVDTPAEQDYKGYRKDIYMKTTEERNIKVTNPYSGQSEMLTQSEAIHYHMVKKFEELGQYELMQEGLSRFSKMNPKAYMTLLD